jgi:hypothetical protein
MIIEYIFEVETGDAVQVKVDLDREFTPERDQASDAFWTPLEFHQCENCPLAKQAYRCCPAAVDIEGLVSKFSQFASFNKVKVRVITPEREYSKSCDVQTGLNAILGLVMATSACPILGKLKSMAKFHLPFATAEETVYRVVGNYLIRQYFLYKDGETPDMDLDGLDALYQDLETVNNAFAERIRAASTKDASINAIVRLSGLAFLVRSSLKKQLLNQRATFIPDQS